MTQLKGDAAIQRFKENEERVDIFVNQNGQYNTNETPPRQVQTLPSFMLDMIARYLAYSLKGNWTSTTAYEVQDIVLQSGVAYMCLVAHTAGTFATDLAAGKWAVYQGVTPNALGAAAGAGIVGFDPSTAYPAGSVGRRLATDYVSITDYPWLAVGDGNIEAGTGTDNRQKIQDALDWCKANKKALHIPDGSFRCIGRVYWGEAVAGETLHDCNDVVVFGNGPSSIIWTDYGTGADVININNAKNLTVRDFAVTSRITNFTEAGSNGVSVTNGFDNINVLDIYVFDLPYVEYPEYLDGGKGFTVQNGGTMVDAGTLNARVHVKGCVHGVGFDINVDAWKNKKAAITVDAVVEDCWEGVLWSGTSPAAPPLADGTNFGLTVRAKAINCQHPLTMSRHFGGNVEVNIVTTKSKAARKLNPNGTQWKVDDSIVTGFVGQYVKNSRIDVHGYLGDCDYKARIGDTFDSYGSFDACDLYIDLGGTAAIANVDVINGGGNVVRNCEIYVSSATATSLPAILYAATYNNTIAVGPAKRFIAPTIQGKLGFAYDDGVTVYNELEREGLSLYFKQTGGSSSDLIVMGTKNHAGAKKFGVRNDGSIVTAGRGGASAVATVKGILPIYDETNTFWGYVPVYTSYTP